MYVSMYFIQKHPKMMSRYVSKLSWDALRYLKTHQDTSRYLKTPKDTKRHLNTHGSIYRQSRGTFFFVIITQTRFDFFLHLLLQKCTDHAVLTRKCYSEARYEPSVHGSIHCCLGKADVACLSISHEKQWLAKLENETRVEWYQWIEHELVRQLW